MNTELMNPDKLFVIRVRQPDGSWQIDLDDTMTRREAETKRKRLRVLMGIATQLWSLKEAQQVFGGSE